MRVPELELPGCELRLTPLRMNDWPALVRYLNQPEVVRYLTSAIPQPYTELDARTFIAQVVAGLWPGPGADARLWALRTPADAASEADALVGCVSLTRGSHQHSESVELGYWLAPPYWGAGVMSATARVVRDWALAHFACHRVHAPVFAPNLASGRVLEKAGFTHEATLRQAVLKDGQRYDELIYASLRA